MLVTSVRSPDYLRFNLVIKFGGFPQLPTPPFSGFSSQNLGRQFTSICWFIIKDIAWVFLVALWIGICLRMQGTQVRSLVQEDSTCLGATKPVRHNYWACVLQLLKPVCLEPVLCNTGSHCDEKPVHHDDSKSQSPRCSNKDPVLPKINKSIS